MTFKIQADMKTRFSAFFQKTAWLTAVLPALLQAPATAQPNEVLASGGQQVQVGNVQLAATLGELAIATVSDGNLILTQGFHQSQAAGCLLFPAAFAAGVGCFGGADGEAWVEVQGGTAPYSYLWSTGATSDHLSGLPAGEYQVTVSDAGGCTQVATALVTQPPQLVIDADTIIDATSGQQDGAIQVTVSGGTPPFLFIWLGPGGVTFDTEDISGLAPGSYMLEVSDQHGCTVVDSFVVDISNAVHQPAWARSVRLSPNPASTLLTLEIPGLPLRALAVEAFDASGRPLPVPAPPPVLDISGWPEGLVCLIVRYGRETAIFRVLVQR